MQISYAITRVGDSGPLCIVLEEADAHFLLMLLRLHTDDEYIYSELVTQIPDETINDTVKDMMVL
jgi:hypothetical protein